MKRIRDDGFLARNIRSAKAIAVQDAATRVRHPSERALAVQLAEDRRRDAISISDECFNRRPDHVYRRTASSGAGIRGNGGDSGVGADLSGSESKRTNLQAGW